MEDIEDYVELSHNDRLIIDQLIDKEIKEVDVQIESSPTEYIKRALESSKWTLEELKGRIKHKRW